MCSINELDLIQLQRLLTRGDIREVLELRLVCRLWKWLIDTWLFERTLVTIPRVNLGTEHRMIIPWRFSVKDLVLQAAIKCHQPPYSREAHVGSLSVDLRKFTRQVRINDVTKEDSPIRRLQLVWGDRF